MLKIWTAFASVAAAAEALADNLRALAQTAAEANSNARSNLGLEVPALPDPEKKTRGKQGA
jgi:hypothetical protein